jgi:hypothetical protein
MGIVKQRARVEKGRNAHQRVSMVDVPMRARAAVRVGEDEHDCRSRHAGLAALVEDVPLVRLMRTRLRAEGMRRAAQRGERPRRTLVMFVRPSTNQIAPKLLRFPGPQKCEIAAKDGT